MGGTSGGGNGAKVWCLGLRLLALEWGNLGVCFSLGTS